MNNQILAAIVTVKVVIILFVFVLLTASKLPKFQIYSNQLITVLVYGKFFQLETALYQNETFVMMKSEC